MASIDYGQIISRSKDLVFKYKWLWVYGLVLAALEGTGFNSFNLPSDSTDKLKDLPEKSQEVLGAATSFLSDWFARVSPATWLLLAAGIIALVLMGIVINLVIRNWAKGSLIAGLDLALKSETVTLGNSSSRGLAALKSLVLFSSLSFVIVLAVVLALFFLGLVLYIISPILGGIYLILAVLALVVIFAFLATIGVYADRLIVFSGYSPWQAWKSGLGFGWRNFFSTFVMGLLNFSLGCGLGCLANLILLIALGLPALIFAWPLFKTPTQVPGPVAWVALAILVILFLIANTLIRALLIVFSYSNWNQFYTQIVTAKHD